jgi:hypothetical protein
MFSFSSLSVNAATQASSMKKKGSLTKPLTKKGVTIQGTHLHISLLLPLRLSSFSLSLYFFLRVSPVISLPLIVSLLYRAKQSTEVHSASLPQYLLCLPRNERYQIYTLMTSYAITAVNRFCIYFFLRFEGSVCETSDSGASAGR